MRKIDIDIEDIPNGMGLDKRMGGRFLRADHIRWFMFS